MIHGIQAIVVCRDERRREQHLVARVAVGGRVRRGDEHTVLERGLVDERRRVELI